MVKADLVNTKEYFDIWQDYRSAESVGADFLDRLDTAKVPVTDAYWAMSDDGEQRELFIATPLHDRDGIRKTAGIFHNILYTMTDEERAGFTLSDVAIVSPLSKNVSAIRQRYGTVNYGSGRRVHRLDNLFNEPFIYRLNQPVPNVLESTTNA
ncbi:MAG: hypothetical protein H7Y38_17555 [Armatimonadetes bacterium]|nr:hypothetical protein [Armatimonadota bacterium]